MTTQIDTLRLASMVALALVVTCFGIMAQADDDQVWNLRGTLGGRLRIEMELDKGDCMDCCLCGSYRYEGKTARLVLSGSLGDDGLVSLEEVDPATGNTTGTFEGKLAKTGFAGSWRDPKGTRKLDFDLKKAPPLATGPNRAWAGSWTNDGGSLSGLSAQIVLRPLPDGQLRARGSATLAVPAGGGEPFARTGGFHGIGAVSGGVLQVRSADYPDCRVTLRLTDDGLRVEDSGHCGGAGLSFDGTYSRD